MVWNHNHWIRCRCSNWMSYQTVNLTRCHTHLFTATPISSLCSVFTLHFGLCLRQLPHVLLAKSRTGNHVVAEWIDAYGIPHWTILRSSSRKLARSGMWTYDHWIPLRLSSRGNYQTMSSTRSQSHNCTANPISSFCSVFPFHFGLCLGQSPHLL